MSTTKKLTCPDCGREIRQYKNPIPTADVIIELEDGIVLIQRKNPPHGWALPGGFIDYGESVEAAAIREAKEETSLNVKIAHLLGVYSEPNRDPRFHTISIVFVASGRGKPRAADDSEQIGVFSRDTLPGDMAFDHAKILKDYFRWREWSEGCREHH